MCWCSDSYSACPEEYDDCMILEPPADDQWRQMTSRREQKTSRADILEADELRKEEARDVAQQKLADQREATWRAAERVRSDNEARSGVRGPDGELEVDALIHASMQYGIPLAPDRAEMRAQVRRVNRRNLGDMNAGLMELAASELQLNNQAFGATLWEANYSIHLGGINLADRLLQAMSGRADRILKAMCLRKELGGSNRTAVRALEAVGGDYQKARQVLVGRTVGNNKKREAQFQCAPRPDPGACAVSASDPGTRHLRRMRCPDFGAAPRYRPGNGYVEPGSVGGLTEQQRQELMMVHNAARKKHCVSPLTWDRFLADQAQRFADTCPCGSSSPDYRGGAGESLAWGYPTALEAAEAWYDEVMDFDSFENGGENSIGIVRHFTNMVWKRTTKFGCGYRSDCREPGGGLGTHVWVCHYFPHGNDPAENCQGNTCGYSVVPKDLC